MMIRRIAVILLLATSLWSQEKQQPPPPPPPPPAGSTVYHFDFTVTEMEGTKKIRARNYSVLVMDGRTGQLRVGNRIPIVTGKEEQVQYMDVGANFDVRPQSVDSRNVRVRVTLEVSALAASDSSRRPVLRTFNNSVETIIPLDKAVLLTSQDEPGTEITFQVQVLARVVK